MDIPLIVLIVVFVLIAIRQVGKVKLQIWQVMSFGAIAVLLTGQIAPYDALKAINLDVMLFLFGMFVIGTALEESGYLSHLSYRFFRWARTDDILLLLVLFGFGLLSAFLMNDTVAIIGTPVVLLLAKRHSLPPKFLLLALAFAVTIGSVMSPIGNPQNLLIALDGNIQNPFVTFFKYLFLPTMMNLLVAFLLLKLFYKKSLPKKRLDHSYEPIRDPRLATLSKISLSLVFILIGVKISLVVLSIDLDLRLTYIALVSMLPVVLFHHGRVDLVKKIDWSTLIFFAAMFILMESVWLSGFFQDLIEGSDINLISIAAILIVSVVLSQFLSNVPMVALYMPMLVHLNASTKGLIALAAGSTIAGNFFILGAASNIIIIQNAEKRGADTITFLDFAKIGIPLTVVNVFVYWVFLTVIP